jgi:hypothetical protein
MNAIAFMIVSSLERFAQTAGTKFTSNDDNARTERILRVMESGSPG